MNRLFDVLRRKPRLKKLVHWLLIRTNQARPRLWVRFFLNPFFHNKGAGSIIRNTSRLDVLPFNKFDLGRNSTIEDFTTINNGVGDIFIGDNTLVGIGNVLIGPLTIGDNIIIAQYVVMSGLNHDYESIDLPISAQPINKRRITIDDDCWIGANVVITSGVKIGKHCVIAAGSIVTRDVPPFSIAAGNPARIIKQYNSGKKTWDKVD
ncbi:MAG: acyltransferase [Flavobacterium sp.]|nr:MAG: acyltransferase [Flavobacterium sp.]